MATWLSLLPAWLPQAPASLNQPSPTSPVGPYRTDHRFSTQGATTGLVSSRASRAALYLAALASNAVVSTAHAAGWSRRPSAASPTAACPAKLRRETTCSPHAMPLRGVVRADGRTSACRGASNASTARSRVICTPSRPTTNDLGPQLGHPGVLTAPEPALFFSSGFISSCVLSSLGQSLPRAVRPSPSHKPPGDGGRG